MPIALAGLTLALSVISGAGFDMGPQFVTGVGFALGTSFAFAIILFQTTRWMKAVDGRMRSVIGMSVVGECRWRSDSSPTASRSALRSPLPSSCSRPRAG